MAAENEEDTNGVRSARSQECVQARTVRYRMEHVVDPEKMRPMLPSRRYGDSSGIPGCLGCMLHDVEGALGYTG